ncbi:MAG: putative transposase [Candidatus Promineifilaceae bacterium]
MEDHQISLRRQCQLAGIPRSTAQYNPVPVNPEDLLLMRLNDEQYLKRPEYGSPRMTDWVA